MEVTGTRYLGISTALLCSSICFTPHASNLQGYMYGLEYMKVYVPDPPYLV
jgi:hypothetical protein